ncbi:glycosyltransferase family 2 protein [Paenibacillus sp. YN15]|uniref:glycosyltransferase family 2 protein n=1 Tax=Paenibacillus sp. YN15 TaxID=1742774 RepID=UPI000DCC5D8D|nr:glycosyltransferase family 2 protein [Paenibacillus sp. YN15]RAV05439.1 glycosyltransferase family 2 protein [Paenibacillus sp. YN15]
MKLLAIIPAYNEAGTIGDVIRSIKKHQPSVDILVVNDGSADHTSEAARLAGAASVLELPFNLGIGGAVQAGYRYACKKNYDLAVQIDADGQHDPAELERILSPIREGAADCCIGSRFLEKRGYRSTLFRRFGIRYFAWMIRSTMKSRLTDPTSGFRAVGREGIQVFAGYYPDDYPEVEAIALLLRKGLTVSEVPVMMHCRQGGSSSITPAKSLYYMAKVSLAVVMTRLRGAEKTG